MPLNLTPRQSYLSMPLLPVLPLLFVGQLTNSPIFKITSSNHAFLLRKFPYFPYLVYQLASLRLESG